MWRSNYKACLLILLLSMSACKSSNQAEKEADCRNETLQIRTSLSGERDPNLQSAQTFEDLNQPYIDLGYTDRTIWIKLQSKPFAAEKKCYMVLEWPTLTNVDFFLETDAGNWNLYGQAGAVLERSKWKVAWLDYPSIPLLRNKEILVRINTRSLVRIPFFILSEEEVRNKTNDRTMYTSFYAGFMLAICLFSLFFFFTLNDQIYLWYGGYIFFVTMNFSLMYSSAPRILLSETPYWLNHGFFFSQALTLFFGVAFFREFVDLRSYYPRFDKIAIAILIFAALSSIASVLSDWNQLFSGVFSLIYMIWIPAFLIVTIRMLIQGQKHLLTFVITWGTFYSAAFVYILWITRVLQPNPIYFYLPVWALPLEVIFFAASIYERYKSIDSRRKILEIEMKTAVDRLSEFSLKPEKSQTSDGKTSKYIRSKIHNTNVNAILGEIERLFTQEMIFKEENLSLATLATRLELNPHQLSEICNTQLNTTFPRLLSYYRIQHSIHLLKEKSEWNILEIAYESGFGSKAAFNAEFKRITGQTPKQFRIFELT
ncbi:helix-turn-helix domain-containing protein [Leptospira selangorensis]|uniref:7TM diverse intracellular signaling domain-containing protein n=1 Tax=Leptospira selangorensis TaxID=2484982 RepID=UPI00108298F4|nr:7TM diverse intracellular signaling domain-containing protein [Leptospira selangorensis]TGK02019.1 helix-turn-helix domain-containing protein [Leptospira selangorensis]